MGAALIRDACSEAGSRKKRALHCLGNDLSEFLTTLDGVHDVLQQGEGVVPATAANTHHSEPVSLKRHR